MERDMEIRDILVGLDGSDAGEARLRLAAALARERNAHVSAVFLLPEQIVGAPPYGGYGAVPPTGAAWMPQTGVAGESEAAHVQPALRADVARGAELADIVEQRFRAELQPQARDGDWHLLGPGESGDVAALAAASDLVIWGQGAPDYPLPAGYGPEDVVLAGGRPTLVVPYAGDFATVGRRVLVAWDGSREAARALHDSLPLIGRAEAALVVSVRDDAADFDESRPGLDRIVYHLGRHGIAATPEETVRGDLPIGDVLLSRAADFDADLIVAGAYHHSQLRESLLGGASRDLLDRMTVPVLMSH